MHRVDEAIAFGLESITPMIPRIAKQPWGHAWPQGEYDKGNKVTHGHCSTAGLVQCRTGDYGICRGLACDDLFLSSSRQVV